MRLLEFIREPAGLFWVFGFPIVLAFALGIAFRNRPVEKLRIAVEQGSPQVARVTDRLAKMDTVEVQVSSREKALQLLRTGKVELVLSVAESKIAAANSQEPFRLVYHFDPTRPESRLTRLAVDDLLQRSLGRTEAAPAADELVTEAGARYIDFLLPGLIGLNVMGSSLWGIGFALVDARRRKLLKRLMATSMRRSHYLLSFMLSRLVFLIAEVAVLTAVGAWIFGVPMRGSFWALGCISLLGAFTSTGIGLLVGARPTSLEAASGLMNFVMLPMWLLSGSFFSYSRFPEFFQPAIRALPLTPLNDSLRAIMIEGAPLVSTWPEILLMLGWGSISFVVALKIFRWQ